MSKPLRSECPPFSFIIFGPQLVLHLMSYFNCDHENPRLKICTNILGYPDKLLKFNAVLNMLKAECWLQSNLATSRTDWSPWLESVSWKSPDKKMTLISFVSIPQQIFDKGNKKYAEKIMIFHGLYVCSMSS